MYMHESMYALHTREFCVISITIIGLPYWSDLWYLMLISGPVDDVRLWERKFSKGLVKICQPMAEDCRFQNFKVNNTLYCQKRYPFEEEEKQGERRNGMRLCKMTSDSFRKCKTHSSLSPSRAQTVNGCAPPIWCHAQRKACGAILTSSSLAASQQIMPKQNEIKTLTACLLCVMFSYPSNSSNETAS